MSAALIWGFATAAVAGGLFLWSPRVRGWDSAALALFFALFTGWTTYDLVQFGWGEGSRPSIAVFGTALLIGVCVRDLVVHWRNDDALAEMASEDRGYVRRRSYAPRTFMIVSLAVTALLWAGYLSFALYSYVQE